MAARAACCIAAWAAAGCGQKGTVTFAIEAPGSDARARALSPFSDPRAETMVLFDERSGSALGAPVPVPKSTTPDVTSPRFVLGDIDVGHYDLVRLNVTGGGQLLGLARTRGVDVLPLTDTLIPIRARKPLGLYGTSTRFTPPVNPQFLPPAPLMLLDTTLPTTPDTLSPVTLPDTATATASTRDGLIVLAADASGRVFALDTRWLDGGRATSAQLEPAPRVMAPAPPPAARAIVVSPDDAWAVVVTDQGISLFEPTALAATTLESIPTVPIDASANAARSASWAPDGKTLAVLTGPHWADLADGKCRPGGVPAVYQEFSVRDRTLQPVIQPTAAPVAATDVAFDSGGNLLFAQPCGSGIVSDKGETVLEGQGIYDVVVAGDRLIGVENIVTTTMPLAGPCPLSPDDSGVRGELKTLGANGQPQRFPFEIPTDHIKIPDSSTEVCLTPQSGQVVAYRAAASPNGSDLVFAYRIRYTLTDAPALTLGSLPNRFQCTADLQRDVYRLTQIDVATGKIGYQKIKGIHDSIPCKLRCENCLLGGCTESFLPACTINDGFAPDGLSVMMGSP